MAISKKTREAVYQKYAGHCAYCGRPIAYKDMQVDHFRPLRAWDTEDAGTDDISNLMPACRMCNHYKRANSIETFRRYIREIPQKPDCDNIAKIVLDALNGLAYDDDSQVTDLEVHKFYGDIGDVFVRLEEIKKAPRQLHL